MEKWPPNARERGRAGRRTDCLSQVELWIFGREDTGETEEYAIYIRLRVRRARDAERGERYDRNRTKMSALPRHESLICQVHATGEVEEEKGRTKAPPVLSSHRSIGRPSFLYRRSMKAATSDLLLCLAHSKGVRPHTLGS